MQHGVQTNKKPNTLMTFCYRTKNIIRNKIIAVGGEHTILTSYG